MDFYKSSFFILLVLISGTVFSQQNTPEVIYSVEGFITDIHGTKLSNVHVVNIIRGNGTISNIEGLFKIHAQPGETIRFTCIGLIPKVFNVPLQSISPIIPLHIILVDDTISLNEVTIYPWPANASALKMAVLAMPPEDQVIPNLRLNEITLEDKSRDFYYQKSNVPGMMDPGVTYAIKGPITALYEQFSKAGKSQRKYELLVFADKRQKIASSRYNSDVVKRVTSFKTDKEIQDFMIYCNLSVDFICNSTEYEFYQAINNCLLAYNAVPNSESP